MLTDEHTDNTDSSNLITKEDFQAKLAVLKQTNYKKDRECVPLAKWLINNREEATHTLYYTNKLLVKEILLLLQYAQAEQEEINQLFYQVNAIFFPTYFMQKDINFISLKQITKIINLLSESAKQHTDPNHHLLTLLPYLKESIDRHPELIKDALLISALQDKLKGTYYVVIEWIKDVFPLVEIIDLSEPSFIAVNNNKEVKDLYSKIRVMVTFYEWCKDSQYLFYKMDREFIQYPQNLFNTISRSTFKKGCESIDPAEMLDLFYEISAASLNFNKNFVPKKQYHHIYLHYKQEIDEHTSFLRLHKLFLEKNYDERNQYARNIFLNLLTRIAIHPSKAGKQVLAILHEDINNPTLKDLQYLGPLPTQRKDNSFIEIIKTICKLDEVTLFRLFNNYKSYLTTHNEKVICTAEEQALITSFLSAFKNYKELIDEVKRQNQQINPFIKIHHLFVTRTITPSYIYAKDKFITLLSDLATLQNTSIIKSTIETIERDEENRNMQKKEGLFFKSNEDNDFIKAIKWLSSIKEDTTLAEIIEEYSLFLTQSTQHPTNENESKFVLEILAKMPEPTNTSQQEQKFLEHFHCEL